MNRVIECEQLVEQYLEVDGNLYELLEDKYNIHYIKTEQHPGINWFKKGDKIYFDFSEDEVYKEIVVPEKVIELKNHTLIFKNETLTILYNNDNICSRGLNPKYFYNLSKGKRFDNLNSMYCEECWNIISRFDDENIDESITSGEIKCNECGYIVPNTHENMRLFNGLKFDDHLITRQYPYPEESRGYKNTEKEKERYKLSMYD